jgi:hypothetical protein
MFHRNLKNREKIHILHLMSRSHIFYTKWNIICNGAKNLTQFCINVADRLNLLPLLGQLLAILLSVSTTSTIQQLQRSPVTSAEVGTR